MRVKVLLLIFVFSLLFKTDPALNQDLGRHLKLGEIIWQTKTVPKTNLFSYTNPDFPFINTHWLFEVLVYLGNQTIGLQWLLVLKIIVVLLSVWLMLQTIPEKNTSLLLPVGFIFLHVLRERTDLRPEIFSFLFTSLTFYILEKFASNSSRRLLFLLPLIQLVWINTHIYFFVGLILQVIYIIYIGYLHLRLHPKGVNLKLMVCIFTLSVLLSLFNPNSLAGLLYPLNVTRNYGYTIVENQTMFLLEKINFVDHNFIFVKAAFIIILFSMIISLIRKKFNLLTSLISVFGLSLALMNVRSFPYLVFLSLPAVLQNFAFKKSFVPITIIFSLLLILESFFYLNGDYYKFRDDSNQASLFLTENAKRALDFVSQNDLPGPIFNNFDIGSYIIYRNYPKYQVFVDGRPEGYPKEFFQNIYIPMQSDYKIFKNFTNQYKFKIIIFSHTDQTPWAKSFLAQVVHDKDWQVIFIDDFMIVLLNKSTPQSQSMPAIDLSKLNPADFTFQNHRSFLNLGLFLLNAGYQKEALTFFTRALSIFPQSPYINSLLGNPSSNFFWY